MVPTSGDCLLAYLVLATFGNLYASPITTPIPIRNHCATITSTTHLAAFNTLRPALGGGASGSGESGAHVRDWLEAHDGVAGTLFALWAVVGGIRCFWAIRLGSTGKGGGRGLQVETDSRSYRRKGD